MTRTLCVTSRSCSVLLDPDGLYEAREKHVLYLDGERLGEEYRSVASLFDLEPDTEYEGWNWYLGRQTGGEWELLQWGY